LFLGGVVNAIKQGTATNADQGHQNKQTEQAAAGATGALQGMSLSEALASTDLDTSSFESLLGKSKEVADGDEDEEEEESTTAEPTPAEKTAAKEDGDQQDSKEDSNNNDGDDDSKEKRLNGRDKNGMYKNHKNYVNLRNKINEQENGH
jgi:hypothetical protein